ncbi:Rv0361 family membrane protein [Mycolicibacterium neworleansense]|uniref:Lumazine-binding domain protein n=1 Tax=Mycolicibacterium neworleansense TaxID=146018 RepID=A0A0H5RMZ0_9MYCO|nr:hypothetical protein [Mycolicibacterium neworleansense]MCV7364360.1 hypothetical protein [Mycolicibacterium neworleansense]CRZ15146.1 hypothetical protein BN2156_02004 [Mycolicibacterium neworleansense]
MTYPPSNPPTPPSGSPGPWQQPYQQGGPQGYPNTSGNPEQPYGSPYGAPQQPQQPQQPYGSPYGAPYGAPQQPQDPYGTQYGGPQQPYGAPYGAQGPYGAQQPYGAPQQPYGYPTPKPPSGGNGKLFAIIGAVVAVLVLIGGIAFFALSGDSDSNKGRTSAGSSQSAGESDAEQEVRDFLDEVMASSSDLSEALPYFCQADQDLFEKIGGIDAIDIPKTTDSSGSAEITKITVDGNKAVVDISSSAGPGKLYLRKESGSWTICMSDMPGMPSMP